MEKKYIYIKKSQGTKLLEFNEKFDEKLFNNLGYTYEDYLDNKWVLLSDEQVAFYENNPSASIKEIITMKMDEKPETDILKEAKMEKINQIEEYDKSDSVNSFKINGVQMWLNVEERQQIATQIEANETVGREVMTRWFNGMEFTFLIDTWRQMLTSLEIYAGDALNITESHKAAVMALSTVSEVENYDYTTNYPTKLEF